MKILDNWCFDDQSTKTQRYGLYHAPTASTNADISRNDFTGNLTGLIDMIVAPTSGQMLDNVGYNPVGQAALSLTSGTAYVAGLTRETVYLQGAGITITKGSTALLSGVSQASVDLLPGESFTPTFSSLSSQFTDKH